MKLISISEEWVPTAVKRLACPRRLRRQNRVAMRYSLKKSADDRQQGAVP